MLTPNAHCNHSTTASISNHPSPPTIHHPPPSVHSQQQPHLPTPPPTPNSVSMSVTLPSSPSAAPPPTTPSLSPTMPSTRRHISFATLLFPKTYTPSPIGVAPTRSRPKTSTSRRPSSTWRIS
ncbi:hypothetical protein Q3G72_011655 [Acer saccharum]|nr:hypothetical protein Q3G72_011655 [Acer saccharum]